MGLSHVPKKVYSSKERRRGGQSHSKAQGSSVPLKGTAGAKALGGTMPGW